MTSKVPFNDLSLHHANLRGEIDKAISDVISGSSFIRGSHVDAFEENFANLLGVDHCVSCANGTDAIYIAMKALGVKPGDEVIVPAHSWISTSETVTQAGAKVVFCDTSDSTFTIDTSQIVEKITPRTVGIIPVHLYGQAADMDEILSIASSNNLWVIEDCAQAHLAEYKGKKVGTFGDAATFSFYPGKNLGAMGDAGAIISNNSELVNNMKRFARHGGITKGEHIIEGINSRMDGIQAAILNIKIKHIVEWTKKRQEVAKKYLLSLANIKELNLPKVMPHNSHVWHLFVIKTYNRDELAEFLKNQGIQTVINYPICLPLLPAYNYLDHSSSDFPVASEHQSRILSLPIYPEIDNEQMDYVISCVRSFYS